MLAMVAAVVKRLVFMLSSGQSVMIVAQDKAEYSCGILAKTLRTQRIEYIEGLGFVYRFSLRE
jgi:hypothetical protein